MATGLGSFPACLSVSPEGHVGQNCLSSPSPTHGPQTPVLEQPEDPKFQTLLSSKAWQAVKRPAYVRPAVTHPHQLHAPLAAPLSV